MLLPATGLFLLCLLYYFSQVSSLSLSLSPPMLVGTYTEQQKKRIFCILGIGINWGLNTDLMICKVSMMHGTCVLSIAAQMDSSFE